MSEGPARAPKLATALRDAAARFSDLTGHGCTLVFADLPGDTRPEAVRCLRAATGFPSLAAARTAAHRVRPLLSCTLEVRPPLLDEPIDEPIDELGEGGRGGTLIVPLGWHGRLRGTVVLGIPGDLSAAAHTAVRELGERTALEIDHAHLEAQFDGPEEPAAGQDEELLQLSEALFAQDIELRRSHESMGRMERLKDDFIEKMSRELRTPLNSIIESIIGILAGEHDSISDQAKISLRSALDAGAAFQRTLENILDLWRLRHNEMGVEIQEVNLGAVVEEAIFSVQDTLDGKPIRVEKQIDPLLPKLRTDLAKVNKLFFLLLDNAVKFTATGRIEIGARLEADRLICTVEDTGIGICADDVPLLYDDFFQVDAHSSATYPGAGLGLAVARELIALMDGTIGLQSEPGRGTRVVFEIPAEAV